MSGIKDPSDSKLSVSSIRIAVVGDKGCGKTSLITIFVSSIFPETVPPVMQQVQVPEETNDGIALSITDTSSATSERENVLKEVAKTDVVILLYSIVENNIVERLEAWLKDLTVVFHGPILVVGNKVDLASKEPVDRTAALRKKVEPLLAKFGTQIDCCWECSAKLNMNVSEVFSIAQNAVLYPLRPLYNTEEKELRPKFKKALTRVFRIFDTDRDGVWSDNELNNFQETCFGVRLQPADISEVKAVLENENSEMVTQSGITYDGFLFINLQFIKRNRAETSWLVLRQFGYDDALDLRIPKEFCAIDRYSDQSVELNRRGIKFIKDIFFLFDDGQKGYLDSQDLANIFSTCPCDMHPWENDKQFIEDSAENLLQVNDVDSLSLPKGCSRLDSLHDFPKGVRTNKNGLLNLEGWISQWVMSALLQPENTLLYMNYLGCNLMPKQVTHLTRRRRIEDERNELQRVVIRCFIFGSERIGGKSLLNLLLRKPIEHKSRNVEKSAKREECSQVRSVCVPLSNPGLQLSSKNTFQKLHIVVTYVDPDPGTLELSLERINLCDIAIMIFNKTERKSLMHLCNIQKQIPETVPCIYLYEDGLKQNRASQESADILQEALDHCNQHNLPPPEPINIGESPILFQRVEKIFELALAAALRPDLARPISSRNRAVRRRRRYLKASLRVALVGIVITGVGIMGYRVFSTYFKSRTHTHESQKQTQ